MQLEELLLFNKFLDMLIKFDYPRYLIAHVNICDFNTPLLILLLYMLLQFLLSHILREISNDQTKVARGDILQVKVDGHLNKCTSHENGMDQQHNNA